MSNPEPTLSVIIVNWNTRELLAQCIQSLYEHLGELSCELVVVDNGSTDGSQALLRERFPQVCLLQNTENVGFARANNRGLAESDGRYALLFNSDAFATPHALQALVSVLESQPRAGIVGAHLVNADGSFQASHTRFPTLAREFLILSGLGRMLFGRWYPSYGPDTEQGAQVVDYVEGACLLVRRDAVNIVGGMDEGYFMYAEEVDWCYAMKQAGWQVWYQPAAKIIHLGGGSSRNRKPERERDLYRSRVRFFRQHYGSAAATWLKWQIYGFTALKILAHGALRFVTGGRRGRVVAPLSSLALE
jgi:hypothetical protein